MEYTPFVKIRSFVRLATVVICKVFYYCHDMSIYAQIYKTYLLRRNLAWNTKCIWTTHRCVTWFLCDFFVFLVGSLISVKKLSAPRGIESSLNGKECSWFVVFDDACSSLKYTNNLFCVLAGPHSRIVHCNYSALMETLGYSNKACKL